MTRAFIINFLIIIISRAKLYNQSQSTSQTVNTGEKFLLQRNHQRELLSQHKKCVVDSRRVSRLRLLGAELVQNRKI